MAGPPPNRSQSVNSYLSPNQQDLLLAALESQTAIKPTTAPPHSDPADNMSATNGNALFIHAPAGIQRDDKVDACGKRRRIQDGIRAIGKKIRVAQDPVAGSRLIVCTLASE